MQDVNELYRHVLTYYGIPYQWGGEGWTKSGGFGYDCSGAARAWAKAGGVILPPGDQSSHDLYRLFREAKNPGCKRGAFAFFGTPEKINHVGFCIDEDTMISAAGGGPTCKTVHIAAQLNAKIKIQPLWWWRKTFVEAWTPKYLFK